MKKPDNIFQDKIKVLKFGGTCLFPDSNRTKALNRIIEENNKGNKVVAVVSAMGRTGDPYATDTLNSLLPSETPNANRERDALIMCGESISASLIAAELSAKGHEAVSIRESQLGLFTNNCYGNAEIIYADPTLIQYHLDKGRIVVAAGFHGTGENGAVYTLGRGGTDTAAVAIAAALNIKEVFFYKDVEGLCSADPQIVPAASPLATIPYDEAAHLAYSGAAVLDPRSADIAKENNISITIKSLEGSSDGTLITSRKKIRQQAPSRNDLFAVSCLEKISQITAIPDKENIDPFFPRDLLRNLAAASISLDMINVLEDKALFTVATDELNRAARVAVESHCSVALKSDCAKISLLGGGIHGVPGVMSRIISALSEVNINIFQSVDTYTVISVLIKGSLCASAAQALHRAFGLDEKS